jgi:hypothetical protein
MRDKKIFLAQSLILGSFEIQQGLIEVKNKLQEIFHLIFIMMIPPVLFGILYLYRSTWRLTVLDENLKPSKRNRLKNFLYAHWHEDIPVLSLKCGPTLFSGDANFCTMASQSRDGEVIARVLKWFGYEVSRGSSHRGGGTALLQMKRAYQSGKNLALAVDGPRGPRHEVKAGVVALAEKGEIPVVIGVSDSKYKFVFRKSWDQMWFPLPFSPVVVIFSDPIRFEADLSFEERRLHIESLARDLKEKAITYYSK